MIPLNDDELNSLLEQARSKPPEPSPELSVRALRAYRENVDRPRNWREFFVRPVLIPLPAGVLAAVFLVFIGVIGDRSFRRPYILVKTHNVEVPVAREHVVYRDCPVIQHGSSTPIASLFREFQPVRQIRPRVVGSIRDDQ